jgi:hypothetical protein
MQSGMRTMGAPCRQSATFGLPMSPCSKPRSAEDEVRRRPYLTPSWYRMMSIATIEITVTAKPPCSKYIRTGTSEHRTPKSCVRICPIRRRLSAPPAALRL